MSKWTHKEQIRIKLIMIEKKLEELGWGDYIDFVNQTVNECAKTNEDSHKVFRMFGMTKKRADGWADISIERCLELEDEGSYIEEELKQRIELTEKGSKTKENT